MSEYIPRPPYLSRPRKKNFASMLAPLVLQPAPTKQG